MSKATRFVLVFLAIALVGLAFVAGYRLGGAPQQSAGIGVVDRAWNILSEDYVEPSKLDPDKLSRAAIEAMIKTLDDPYTSYLTPMDYQMSVSNMHGEFEGIGATVGTREGQITIIAPIKGSPAEKAGIRPGDVILAIDDITTSGLNVNDAVLKIRGTKGTIVRLRVQHAGEPEPVDIEITRDTVKVNSVFSEMKGDIAYINISQFAEKTDDELVTALQAMSSQNATGIILDLRRDPGGLLETVINVAGHFIKEGTAVQTRSNRGQVTVYDIRKTDVFTDLPMVVLVDAYSASGSEVLSGALQDYKRAVIAGQTTYGKGSVNILRRLDKGGIYVTTGRWLTPNGRMIEGKGIEPDVVLDPSADALQWAIDYLHGTK